MEEDDHSPQITGVVIISLPPPDNPSLGKTITAFTLTDDTNINNSEFPQNQTHLPLQSPPPFPLPPQPVQDPQTQFSSSRFFFPGTPGKVLSFVCISLFALIIYSSVFSTTLQELKSDNDDKKPKSFIFPLYHKFGIREVSQKDLQLKLGGLVFKDKLLSETVGDRVIGRPQKIKKLASSTAASVDASSVFPVRGNVFPDGLYFTYILVGSPPSPYFLDIDTGSDLTWIQCDAPCSSCAKGANELYKPRRGNILPPKDSLCMEVQRNQKAGICETCQQCDYEIVYADDSSSMGVLAKDDLHLMVSNGSLTKQNIIFGCAYDQQGLLLNTLAKTDGIIGLSRAKVSLPSQLANQGVINNVVGHCLTNDVGGGGYMFLGDDFVPRWGMAWVPMLGMGLYQTEIARLNYGSTLLRLDGRDRRVRRVVFDTGSSYTYFTKEAYSDLVASLEQVAAMGLILDKSDPTLPFCWKAKFPIRSVTDVKQFFKTLTLEFGSRWRMISTKLRIRPEGYLIVSDKGNVCLGILDGSKVHDGSAILLGDISLRGQLIIYDNMNKKIGWTASDCVKPMRSRSLPFFEDSLL